jgi:hypothetical protein
VYNVVSLGIVWKQYQYLFFAKRHCKKLCLLNGKSVEWEGGICYSLDENRDRTGLYSYIEELVKDIPECY